MTKVSKIPVKEPEGDIQFSSQEKLYDHVCRHVLRNYGQRWGQFIDPDLLNKVRKK